MKAVVRLADAPGDASEVEFEVDPAEIAEHSPEAAMATAQCCAQMARSLWLAIRSDIDTAAWVAAQATPDDPSSLTTSSGEAEATEPPA